MKKGFRNGFVIIIILLALLGIWYWLAATDTKPSDTKAEIVIYSASKENIKRLEVKTEGEEYAVYQNDAGWFPENKKNVALLPVRMDILTDKLCKIAATQVVEQEARDLGKYGLRTPIRVTKVILSDGSFETLCVGNETPDKQNRYFKIGSNNSVYTVSWTGLNDYAPMFVNLRDMNIESAYAADNVKDFSIYSKKDDGLYKFKKSADLTDAELATDFVRDTTVNDWKLVTPFVATANDEKLKADILAKLESVWASDYIDDAPTDLAKYGLASPEYIVEFTRVDGSSAKLLIGSTVTSKMVVDAASKVYIMAESKPNVFAIPQENIKFLYSDLFEYLNTIPIITKIADVSSVEIKRADKAYRLGINRGDNKNEYAINGKAISEADFKDIYLDLIGFTAHGLSAANEKIDGNKIMTIAFNLKDGSEKEIYFVYKDERNSVIVINGKPNFYVLNKYLTNFIDKIERIGALG